MNDRTLQLVFFSIIYKFLKCRWYSPLTCLIIVYFLSLLSWIFDLFTLLKFSLILLITKIYELILHENLRLSAYFVIVGHLIGYTLQYLSIDFIEKIWWLIICYPDLIVYLHYFNWSNAVFFHLYSMVIHIPRCKLNIPKHNRKVSHKLQIFADIPLFLET